MAVLPLIKRAQDCEKQINWLRAELENEFSGHSLDPAIKDDRIKISGYSMLRNWMKA